MAKRFSTPPLTAVRAFEAVARLGNFTKAAEELGTTQAAVSYQIKLLEEKAGVQLLLRQPKRSVLTEPGALLAEKISQAFALLEEGWAATKGSAQGRLVISSVPTFAIGWLVRHLGDFQKEHPQLSVRLETGTRFGDTVGEGVDLEIRGGYGKWRGLKSDLLMEARFTPMLSPSLAKSIGGIKTPDDLLQLPLIDPYDPWWSVWFADMKTTWVPKQDLPESRMHSQVYEAISAMSDGGVALLTPAFYRNELGAGLLLQPFDHLGWDGFGYWLVYPEGKAQSPKVRSFRKWLLLKVEKMAKRPTGR